MAGLICVQLLAVGFKGIVITHFRPSTVHADLCNDFFDAVEAASFPKLDLRYRNEDWAKRVGLDGLSATEWITHFGAFEPLNGSFEQPLALRYHGHQFQHYNPDLGDGRGFLFAQLLDDTDRVLDLGTKGSGQTPWSRAGDGRLTLKGGVREVIAARLLEAQGVDTSKPFSLIETGEQLYRNDEPSPARSAVLVRLNHSHIRIGTFQRLAFLKDDAGIEKLVDHCVAHYYSHFLSLSDGEKAVAFFEAVVERVALTGANWIAAGFVHGVLNTDNINITGESFDYGPWRFLPTYDNEFTAAYFDQNGLYAYGRQPDALAWNLTRLAGCLLPLAAQEHLEVALNTFWPKFRAAMAKAYVRRLGLVSAGEQTDLELVEALMRFMGSSQAPYEQVLFDWYGGMASAERAAKNPNADFYTHDDFAQLKKMLSGYAPHPDLQLAHPYFARPKPRTMLIDELEAIWAPIAENDDWQAFEDALTDIALMQEAYMGT